MRRVMVMAMALGLVATPAWAVDLTITLTAAQAALAVEARDAYNARYLKSFTSEQFVKAALREFVLKHHVAYQAEASAETAREAVIDDGKTTFPEE